GEATRLLADDCVVDHCDRGAAIQDGSTAILRRVQVLGCNSGIDACQKKALHGRAGRALLVDCTVAQSAKSDFASEKRGRVELLRTPRTRVDDQADQAPKADADARVVTVDAVAADFADVIRELEAIGR